MCSSAEEKNKEWIFSFWFYRWKERSIKKVQRTLGWIKTINSGKKGEYGKDLMKIKINTDDNLSVNKPLKLHLLTIIVRCIFEEDG